MWRADLEAFLCQSDPERTGRTGQAPSVMEGLWDFQRQDPREKVWTWPRCGRDAVCVSGCVLVGVAGWRKRIGLAWRIS